MSIKLDQKVEDRTYSLKIEGPIGGPFKVVAMRQRNLFDITTGLPIRDGAGNIIFIQDGERRIDRTVKFTDDDGIKISAIFDAMVDRWAKEIV